MAHSPRSPHSPYTDADIPTRTVAIVKHHALDHRLAIERRIEEAGFEIIKERQMEFDDSSDDDFLHELFGEDAPSLFEGPVWVYVLGRTRAVPVFKSLMGDPDPDTARQLAPNSLRALFGISADQNAIMAAPDNRTAEEQIACLFASSPPFPPTYVGDEFEDVEDEHDRALGDRDGGHDDDDGQGIAFGEDAEEWKENKALSPSSSRTAASSHSASPSSRGRSMNLPSYIPNTSPSHHLASPTNSDKRVPFRARPVPSTNSVPSIRPRMSRAAEIRVALKKSAEESPKRKSSKFVPPVYSKARDCPTREEVKQVFMDVPGHKRSTPIKVASTAPPTIAPRMTRAVSLRLGIPMSPKAPAMKKSLSTGTTATVSTKGVNDKSQEENGKKNVFEGVPGHKRAETIPVASVKPPTVAPRQNKAAALRVHKDSGPPSSFMFKLPTERVLPGAAGAPTRSSSRMSTHGGGDHADLPARPETSQSSYGTATVYIPHSHTRRPSISQGTSAMNVNDNESPNRTRSSSHTRAPSITPRSNKSALLRQRSGSISVGVASPAKLGRALA